MISQYQTLITIALKHEYFTGNVFNSYTIAPLAETAAYMTRRGMLIKNAGNQLKVLMDEGPDPEFKYKQLYKDQISLKFALTITDPYFHNYTADLDKNASGSVYYFSNFTGGKPRKRNNLHTADHVTEKDARPAAELAHLFFARPFAIIDITLDEQMQKDVTISFKAQSTYWKYVVVSEHLQDYGSLAVLEGQENRFEGPKDVQLANESKAVVFESREPIKLADRPAKSFSLVDHYDPELNRFHILIRHLPAPDISRISAATEITDKQSNYSEIFI